MHIESQQPWTAILAAVSAVVPVLFGLLPGRILDRHGGGAARAGSWAAAAALGAAILACAGLAWQGSAHVRVRVAEPFSLGIHLDSLSAIVLLLVAFLLAVISRFSIHYLAGDPGQGRFARWLSLTGGSVLTMVVSGNLLQFSIAWCATSLCLHRLLVFYPGRPGAVLAARKKFLVSRLGDVLLLAAIVLVFERFGTWDFSALFVAARDLHSAGLPEGDGRVGLISLLLVGAAMLKSAQFPFHSWLPDTMETPTPVSALMHAGIINGGGYLILRLNPLVTLSPGALSLLAVAGAFTALFASLVMLTHASVKRSLAFSTVAQMGFMMLECGLGAFGLALLHLVAHSLYKAHAFLSSGSIVRLAQGAWTPTEKPGAHPGILAGSFIAAALLCGAGAWRAGVSYRDDPGQILLACVFAMGSGYGLWTLWSRGLTLPRVAVGLLLNAALVTLYFLLHHLFARLPGSQEWMNAQFGSLPGAALLAVLLGLFLVVLLLQAELPQWAHHPRVQALYVHARNGFYFNTLANRLVMALLPVKVPRAPKPPRPNP